MAQTFSASRDDLLARFSTSWQNWRTLTRREMFIRAGIILAIITGVIFFIVIAYAVGSHGSGTTPAPANGTSTTEAPFTTTMDPANSTTTEATTTVPTSTAPTPVTTTNATTTSVTTTITSSPTTKMTTSSTTPRPPGPVPTKQPLPDDPYKIHAVTLLFQVLTTRPNFTDLVCDEGIPKIYQTTVIIGNYTFTGEASKLRKVAREYTAQVAAKELFNLRNYPPPTKPIRPCHHGNEETINKLEKSTLR